MSGQYFAQLNDDNVCIRVKVVDKDFLEANPQRYPGRWVETFIGVEGKIYANEGYIYDEATKNFIVPEVE